MGSKLRSRVKVSVVALAREVQTKSFKSLKRDRGEEVQQREAALPLRGFQVSSGGWGRWRSANDRRVTRYERHLRNFLRGLTFADHERDTESSLPRGITDISIRAAFGNETSRFLSRDRGKFIMRAATTANWVIEKTSRSQLCENFIHLRAANAALLSGAESLSGRTFFSKNRVGRREIESRE